MRSVCRLLLVALVTMVFAALPLVASAAPGGNGNGGNSAAAHSCQQGGYESFLGDFKNTGQCVSYAAKGGELTSASLSAVFDTVNQTVTITGTGLEPGSDVAIHVTYPNIQPVDQVIGTVNPDGTFSLQLGYGCNFFTSFYLTGTAANGASVNSPTYNSPC